MALQGFRNIVEAELDLHPHLNVIAGKNGQGKTNLLEAIYLLLARRSFRTSRLRELIHFEYQQTFIRGKVELGDIERVFQLHISPQRKVLRIDNKLARGRDDALAAVLFTPDDLQVPKGSPAQRRQLLDAAVAIGWPGYLGLYRQYQRALATRNRVLKNRPAQLDALLNAYDRQVAALGAKIILARQRYVRMIAPLFGQTFSRIMGNAHHATLHYLHDAEGALETLPQHAQQLSARLRAERAQDILQGKTRSGPQAHDLQLLIDGRDARRFASQGQARGLVLAFKMSQIVDTYQRWGHYPLLLLDDVSSELDAEREAHLFDFISEISCQTLVTTTRPELIKERKKRKDFKVLAGIFHPEFP